METIKTREELIRLIETSNGKFFTVTFIKKDDSIRTMNARLGVKKYLKGGVLSYSPREKRLIPVWDIKKHQYKMINKDTVLRLRISGKDYKVW